MKRRYRVWRFLTNFLKDFLKEPADPAASLPSTTSKSPSPVWPASSAPFNALTMEFSPEQTAPAELFVSEEVSTNSNNLRSGAATNRGGKARNKVSVSRCPRKIGASRSLVCALQDSYMKHDRRRRRGRRPSLRRRLGRQRRSSLLLLLLFREAVQEAPGPRSGADSTEPATGGAGDGALHLGIGPSGRKGR